MITLKITHHYYKAKNPCLDIDVTLPASGINMIYGDSGAGKSSLLKCIAGIENPQTAKITVGNKVLVDTQQRLYLPAHQRNIGYLMQGQQLFPHLTIKNNLSYAWTRAKKLQAANNAQIIDMAEAIHFFALTELLNHYPHQLSGGEQQRVAIARVLLSQPSLLLFDESTTALDNPTQEKILSYIVNLHHVYKIPIIFVTHAIKDVVTAAQHILVLSAGKVVAQGDFQSIIAQEAFLRLAGNTHLLEGKVIAQDDLQQRTIVAWKDLHLTMPQFTAQIGDTIRLWQYYSNKGNH